MIAHQISDMKRGVKSTAAMAAWGLLAAIAVGIAVLWFAVALFVFLTDRYDAVTASLSVGGCFLLVAGMAVLAIVYIRRQREVEQRVAAKANSTAWVEPALLAAGLDVARLIGGRRAVSLAAGAAAVVWLLNKSNSESAERRRAGKYKV